MAASATVSSLVSLGLSILVFTACTSSSSVPLTGPATPPANPGEQGNEANPTPTPTPSPSPTPGNPGNGGDSETPPPTPNPTPNPVSSIEARIYCMPGGGMNSASPLLNSLPGNAVDFYKMANIGFYLEDGSRATGVKFPVALTSDGRDSTLLLEARMAATDSWKIYKAKVDFLKEQGVLNLLSTNTRKPNEFPYIKENLNLPMKLTDANASRNAFVYPNDNGDYVIETLKGAKKTLPLSVGTYANPKFVRDTWVVFDQVTSGYKIIQKFYSVASGQITSLPSPDDSRDYQLFGHVTTQEIFYWLEGRPGNGWKVKSYNKKSKSASTLGPLPGVNKNIQLPAVFFDRGGSLQLAYLEESIAVDTKGMLYTEKGLLRILAVSSTKLSGAKSIEYSDRVKQMIVMPKTSMPELLRYLFFEPVSGRLYASIMALGGLASYDLNKDTWATHATTDLCTNPSAGVEEIHD